MNRVLEEFVDYARFPEPNFRQTDINTLIQEVAQFMTPEAKEHQVSFELKLASNLRPIEADEEQIRQLMINLCANAMQAMPRGGSITMTTEAVENGDDIGPSVRISVSDRGTGIAEEKIQGIFEPFYSTKPDGLGLGLAIVSRIIDLHNGKISCHSQVGQGTTFVIVLPLAPANWHHPPTPKRTG